MADHQELKKIIEEVIDKKLEPFQPMLKFYNDATSATNFLTVVMKSILLFGAVVGVIYGFFRWIKN